MPKIFDPSNVPNPPVLWPAMIAKTVEHHIKDLISKKLSSHPTARYPKRVRESGFGVFARFGR